MCVVSRVNQGRLPEGGKVYATFAKGGLREEEGGHLRDRKTVQRLRDNSPKETSLGEALLRHFEHGPQAV